jgi:hypothetical protein
MLTWDGETRAGNMTVVKLAFLYLELSFAAALLIGLTWRKLGEQLVVPPSADSSSK